MAKPELAPQSKSGEYWYEQKVGEKRGSFLFLLVRGELVRGGRTCSGRRPECESWVAGTRRWPGSYTAVWGSQAVDGGVAVLTKGERTTEIGGKRWQCERKCVAAMFARTPKAPQCSRGLFHAEVGPRAKEGK
jgi:hypothetical protein